jgi:hypothetical protein
MLIGAVGSALSNGMGADLATAADAAVPDDFFMVAAG